MDGNYKHRAYPFENENSVISRSNKREKKRQMHRSYRRIEKINLNRIRNEKNFEDFEEPDLGYEYIM